MLTKTITFLTSAGLAWVRKPAKCRVECESGEARGLEARSRALPGFATYARATSVFLFLLPSPPPPPPPPKKNRHLLHRLQLCRRLRQLDELEHGRTKHGRSCRSIPEARCGICVNLVKFLIGRESGINFFFLPILKLDLAKPSLSAVIIHSTHD